ncbi:MAG: thioredoxin family protein [Melioribacteraceae bacterium]|nr:thioredoxin family protein [Melioribacteraceae bacterium]
MNQKELLEKVKNKSISFEQFNNQADTYSVDIDESSLDEVERKKLGFTTLNQKRTYRILKTYKVSEKIKEVVSKITEPQTWMILTEDWCGDSAQNLPYLYKISQLNDRIDLKLLYRDDNLEIMDRYLTNGGRAIPKLVAFDKDGNELFQWGPRPEEARKLVAQWKAEGDAADQFNEKLHLWYGRNRGKAFDDDFLKLLTS